MKHFQNIYIVIHKKRIHFQNKILNIFSYLHYNTLYIIKLNVNLNKSPVNFSIVWETMFHSKGI